MNLYALVGPLSILLLGVSTPLWVPGLDPYNTAVTASMIVAIGVLCTLTAHGRRGLRELAQALMITNSDEATDTQRSAVRECSRSMVIAGTCIGLVAALLILTMFRLPSDERRPAMFAHLIQWALRSPLIGLFLGQVWIGSIADRVGATNSCGHGLVLGSVAIAITAFVGICLPA